PAAGPGFDVSRPAVEASESADEGQADANASPGVLALLERLEDRILHSVGNAGALVFDEDDDAVGPRLRVDVDRRSRRRVTAGVAEEVLDDPLDLPPIDGDERVVALDANGVAGERGDLGRQAAGEIDDVGRLSVGL